MNLCELRDAILEPCTHCLPLREAVAALHRAANDASRHPTACQPRLLASGRHTSGDTVLPEVVTLERPGVQVHCPVCRNRGAVMTEEGRQLLRTLAPLFREAANTP